MKKPAKATPRMVTKDAKPKPAKAARKSKARTCLHAARVQFIALSTQRQVDALRQRVTAMEAVTGSAKTLVESLTSHDSRTPHPDDERVKKAKDRLRQLTGWTKPCNEWAKGRLDLAKEILRILSTPAKRKPR